MSRFTKCMLFGAGFCFGAMRLRATWVEANGCKGAVLLCWWALVILYMASGAIYHGIKLAREPKPAAEPVNTPFKPVSDARDSRAVWGFIIGVIAIAISAWLAFALLGGGHYIVFAIGMLFQYVVAVPMGLAAVTALTEDVDYTVQALAWRLGVAPKDLHNHVISLDEAVRTAGTMKAQPRVGDVFIQDATGRINTCSDCVSCAARQVCPDAAKELLKPRVSRARAMASGYATMYG